MVFWFLFAALMLVDGRPAAPVPSVYLTEQACNDAGLALSAQVVAQKEIRQGVWLCSSVVFDRDDPLPPLLPSRDLSNG